MYRWNSMDTFFPYCVYNNVNQQSGTAVAVALITITIENTFNSNKKKRKCIVCLTPRLKVMTLPSMSSLFKFKFKNEIKEDNKIKREFYFKKK